MANPQNKIECETCRFVCRDGDDDCYICQDKVIRQHSSGFSDYDSYSLSAADRMPEKFWMILKAFREQPPAQNLFQVVHQFNPHRSEFEICAVFTNKADADAYQPEHSHKCIVEKSMPDILDRLLLQRLDSLGLKLEITPS